MRENYVFDHHRPTEAFVNKPGKLHAQFTNLYSSTQASHCLINLTEPTTVVCEWRRMPGQQQKASRNNLRKKSNNQHLVCLREVADVSTGLHQCSVIGYLF